LAHLALTLGEPQEEIARSGADGRFEFSGPDRKSQPHAEGRYELELLPGQGWICASTTSFWARSTELLVVAAPAIELGGSVEDEAGAFLAGARLELRIASEDLSAFPLPLDRNGQAEFKTESAADGTFHMPAVPAVAGATLRAFSGEDRQGEIALPVATSLDLRIVLKTREALGKDPHLSGIVLSAEGQPVAGARVLLTGLSTTSASDGHFDLVAPDWEFGGQLFAVKVGFQPGMVELSERAAQNDDSPIVVHLGPQSLEIRGTVLLADGKPAAGWSVVLNGGTEVSGMQLAENLAAGLSGHYRQLATSATGTFTLTGLSPRAYGVRVWDSKTLLTLTAEEVPAGTHDLVLRVPSDAFWPEVRGKVVDRRGAPVAGAKVNVQLTTFRTRNSAYSESTEGVETSADGSFQLTGVPRRDVVLTISGDELIAKQFSSDQLDMKSELRLVAELRCHVRLLCEGKEDLPDRVEVIGAGGDPMPIFTFMPGGWSSMQALWITQTGSTHAFAVGDSATTLILFKEEEELARLPLTLVPGQVTELRY
ncbi:MAG TPA: carboxypeptidase-like regulatory domain-containing protein, partial [Planctomycetota bacterium]|nr:carboxypeptidase-like regulatory domain-containing protein [Planctomycetota bacterium]